MSWTAWGPPAPRAPPAGLVPLSALAPQPLLHPQHRQGRVLRDPTPAPGRYGTGALQARPSIPSHTWLGCARSIPSPGMLPQAQGHLSLSTSQKPVSSSFPSNGAGTAGGPARPHGSARLPLSLTGLQRAPCGCFFNPQLFSMQWTVPNPTPADTSTMGFSAATLPGAALLGTGDCAALPAWAAPGTPQGPAQHLAPQNRQGTGAPALPEQSPLNHHINGVPAGNNIASTNTSMGITPANHIPTGSTILLNPSSNHQNQGLGEPDRDIEVTEEMLLKEALRLFGLSEEMEAVIQHGSNSVIMPEDHGDTIRKGRTLAPAAPHLLNSIPSNKNIEGVSARPNIPSTATSVGTTLGINIPPGNNVPPRPSSDPHHQGFGDLNDSLARDKEVPLEEALRFFGCYEDTERVIQEGSSSSCMPEDPGGTDTDIPLYDFSSLSLPDELLTCDYDVNEIAKVIQSLEDTIDTGVYPNEFWADVGMDLEPSQPDSAQQWETNGRMILLSPSAGSQDRRVPAGLNGHRPMQGQHRDPGTRTELGARWGQTHMKRGAERQHRDSPPELSNTSSLNH
uniref:Uncharacterized protein n=1 Tax=Melopsittacus undulatus TaxID=13146 RepID=A0A8V5G9Z2_MELUD